jgi:hypothetical protein
MYFKKRVFPSIPVSFHVPYLSWQIAVPLSARRLQMNTICTLSLRNPFFVTLFLFLTPLHIQKTPPHQRGIPYSTPTRQSRSASQNVIEMAYDNIKK